MLMLLVALTAQAIAPADLRDVNKVAFVCRSALKISERSGDAIDWLKHIRAASDAGELNVEQRAVLVTMCGVYSAAVRDEAQEQLNHTIKELDQNTEDLRQLIDQ